MCPLAPRARVESCATGDKEPVSKRRSLRSNALETATLLTYEYRFSTFETGSKPPPLPERRNRRNGGIHKGPRFLRITTHALAGRRQ